MAIHVTRSLVVELVRRKEEIRREVEAIIGRGGVERALRDSHARRPPIACGLTIHTGVGCGYGCVYCYIYDMGFPAKPRPYPLSGLELVYALSSNPYLVPGRHGTMLAFGSVTEPFQAETIDRSLEYLEATREWLGNPTQISTKTALSGRSFYRFVESVEDDIDVLVSITTIKHWRLLEPGASPPLERIRFMRDLISTGINATLFLRPIIPGVTDKEARELVSLAASAGVKRVVLGSLRVTNRILRRLEATKVVDVDGLRARMPRNPRSPRDQVTLKMRDVKELVGKVASSLGMQVLPASCSSNMYSHRLSCYACRLGPCGDPESLPRTSQDSIEAILEYAGGRLANARIMVDRVEYTYIGDRGAEAVANSWITSLLKRRPIPRRWRV